MFRGGCEGARGFRVSPWREKRAERERERKRKKERKKEEKEAKWRVPEGPW